MPRIYFCSVYISQLKIFFAFSVERQSVQFWLGCWPCPCSGPSSHGTSEADRWQHSWWLLSPWRTWSYPPTPRRTTRSPRGWHKGQHNNYSFPTGFYVELFLKRGPCALKLRNLGTHIVFRSTRLNIFVIKLESFIFIHALVVLNKNSKLHSKIFKHILYADNMVAL